MPDNRQNKLACPECKHGDGLKKVSKEDFYRCSGCGNEWFDEEIIKVPYKTATFVNEDGKVIYIAQTPERKQKMNDKGVYKKGYVGPFSGVHTRMNKRRANMSRKDKNLLRRLRK
jgi:ssDNA-binding Zn-finger/Zn-ribbon topoisomerase 1